MMAGAAAAVAGGVDVGWVLAEFTAEDRGKACVHACMHACAYVCMHAYMHASMHAKTNHKNNLFVFLVLVVV